MSDAPCNSWAPLILFAAENVFSALSCDRGEKHECLMMQQLMRHDSAATDETQETTE